MYCNTTSFLLFVSVLTISSSFSATSLYAEMDFCATPPISIINEEDGGTEPTVVQYLVASKDLRWERGKTVKVAFDFQGRNLVGSYKPYMCKSVTTQKECETLIISEVATIANVWSQYGNIGFRFVGVPWNEGEIRVRFVNRSGGGHSAVGTNAKGYPLDKNTMQLGLNGETTLEYFRRAVTHEFGHAIGFQHEHQSPDVPYNWVEEQVISDYQNLYGEKEWPRDSVIEFVLTPLDELPYITKTELFYTEYDPYSIMVYWIKRNWVSNPEICPSKKPEWCIESNTKLSEMDKLGIAQLYPGVPFPPSNLSATVLSSSSIKVSWADKSNNETGFKIYHWDESKRKWSNVATVGANVTSYTNTGLQAGITYNHLVSAYNKVRVDNYASNYTTAATAQPAAPSNLSATTLSSSSIKVTWGDKSNNETGFRIYRWNGSEWSRIYTVGRNVTSYTDKGLQTRTSYYYQVSAYNGVGESYASTNTLTTTK